LILYITYLVRRKATVVVCIYYCWSYLYLYW